MFLLNKVWTKWLLRSLPPLREGRLLVFIGHVLGALCSPTVSYLILSIILSGKCCYSSLTNEKPQPPKDGFEACPSSNEPSSVKLEFHSKSVQHQSPLSPILALLSSHGDFAVSSGYLEKRKSYHMTLSLFSSQQRLGAKPSTPFTGITKSITNSQKPIPWKFKPNFNGWNIVNMYGIVDYISRLITQNEVETETIF